ncbi:MAG TPA: glycosyltransferase family 2 protein [Anaerolineales bacterium]|nr:glycosyltransferase family 2 protein [Anaerolineales bacterium]
MAPLISIITPSYNRAKFITHAIESVLAQDCSHIEHIVVDGGSTDSTPELVNKYPHIRFFSEPDQGMYDALNKGIERATGEIIGFLNTDDLYEKDIFSKVAEAFAEESVMAVAGRAIVFKEVLEGKPVVIEEYSPDKNSLLEDSTIGSNYFNAWFFHRSVFDKIGKFHIGYRIIGDRDFMLRFALGGLKYVTINRVTYEYYQHVESLTFDKSGEKLEQSALEHLEMTHSYLRTFGLSSLQKKMITRLRTNNSIELAVRSLRRLDLKGFVNYSYEGLRYDLFWPFRFLKFVLKNGIRVLFKSRLFSVPLALLRHE